MLLEIRLVNSSGTVRAKLIEHNCRNCLELVGTNRIANDVFPDANDLSLGVHLNSSESKSLGPNVAIEETAWFVLPGVATASARDGIEYFTSRFESLVARFRPNSLRGISIICSVCINISDAHALDTFAFISQDWSDFWSLLAAIIINIENAFFSSRNLSFWMMFGNETKIISISLNKVFQFYA